MAEGIFNVLLKERQIDSIECSSAGTNAFAGDEVSQNAVIAAAEYGADISSHRARPLNGYMLLDADLFVCMSDNHRFAVASAVGSSRTMVLGNGISDPFGSDEETYKKCASEIYDALQELLEKLLNEVIIVPMQKCHVSSVAEIEKECFSSPWSEKSLLEETENENSHFLAALFKGKIVGYMGVQSIAGECYVTNIAVNPDFRRRGIGAKLIDRAVRDSVLRNDEFISLEVRKSNSQAISLYEKFGFTVEGERKNFYSSPTEDGYIMTLRFEDNNK